MASEVLAREILEVMGEEIAWLDDADGGAIELRRWVAIESSICGLESEPFGLMMLLPWFESLLIIEPAIMLIIPVVPGVFCMG